MIDREPMGEVSSEVLATSSKMSEYLGVPVERLFGPHQHLLTDPPERISWDEYADLKETAAQIAGTDERLIALGEAVMRTPKTAVGARALALVVDPAVVMLKASKNGWGRYFSNLDVTCRQEGERVCVEIHLHPGYRPCRPFFVQNAGILVYAPRLIGCGPADVEWTTDGYHGIYLVTLPRSRTLWSYVTRLFRVLLNTQTTIAELTNQQELLNKKNRELTTALRESKAALATRDRFLQTIDHELRTPLNGMRGGIEALTEHVPPSGTEWLAMLERSEARLSDVIRSILEYSRLASDRLTPQRRDFRPSDIAAHAIAETRRRDPTFDVAITTSLDTKTWLRGDDERIQRVVHELLVNAMVHAPGRPVNLEVHHDADHLTFEVRDHGPGIAPNDADRIFEPFVQVQERASRSIAGSGLGLSIARATVGALGGTLEVEQSNVGAHFVVRFPIEVSDRTDEPTSRTRMVLLVDDDKINRVVGKRLLERLGCVVTVAEDGLEALEKYDTATFDLVLMDCEMPNLDGWSATRRLRADRSADLPVVAVTAYTSDADRRRCVEAGMNDFIPKPLSLASLTTVLERWTAAGTQASK